MNPEDTSFDPALEQAAAEIGGEPIPDTVVDAAAERVWSRLEAAMATGHIRECAGFQALFPDYRVSRLAEARAMLVQDHLRECIACRRVYEGGVIPFSEAPSRGRKGAVPRWAIAAGVVATGGLAAWFAISQYSAGSGRALVRSINGTLYEVSAGGLRQMAAGEALPDGVEIRTARGSQATVALLDGSLAEVRERSDLFASTSGSDTTLHLDRGSVMVQAAHRRSGHLYVATADFRVAVTGTMFSVSAGVKGSRVSVVEGQVSVSRENRERVLGPGEQWSTGESLEPLPVRDDLRWSYNARLPRALASLRESLAPVRFPQARFDSRLLRLLPASTVFYASIPNLSGYFAEAQGLFRRKSAESAELRDWLAGPGALVEPLLERLRTANEYLGDEIVVFGTAVAPAPVVLAEVKRPGLAEFLKGAGLPVATEIRGSMVLLSPIPGALTVALDSTFQNTAFYQQIAQAYRQGAGLLVCADLMRMPPHPGPPLLSGPPNLGGRYLIAEQKQAADGAQTRATLSFDDSRQGMAVWLAAPAPIGALNYVTPDATLLAAFSVTNAAAVLDQVWQALPPANRPKAGSDEQVQQQLAASLGGEFAVALDGPPLPVPSWKLIAEVNDPQRFEAALEKWVAAYNATNATKLRMARETVDGRAWYRFGWGEPNPLTEAQYTFSSGYLIAAPTRALVARALETNAGGAGLARSQPFTALLPRDSYTDFSAVIYQNLGTTLAPYAALLGPKAADLGKLKPLLVTAYAEPERITLASTGDLLGMSFNNVLSGSLFGIAQDMLPMAGFLGTSHPSNSSR